MRFTLDNPWHAGAAELLTYEPEELLGTKLRALYQRKKGRDLFDLSEALTSVAGIEADKIVDCFARYMQHDGRRVTRTQFERNLAGKVEDEVFLGDVPPLLALGVSFDPRVALRQVQDALLSRLPEAASRKRARRRE